MKISKRQLNKIIKEEKAKLQEGPKPQDYDILDFDFRNAIALALDAGILIDNINDTFESAKSYAVTSRDSRKDSRNEFNEENWIPWLEERGLSVDDLDHAANFVGSPDRSELPAFPPQDGMIGPADLEAWAKDMMR